MHPPKYIPAIDGLRAIAVGLVIAFHLEPSILKGGFIGVDIFFVISGFLISGIIVDDINAGRFSYGRFLLRRVRRLAPALLTVLAFSSMVALLIEYPDELLGFSNSLISTITLVSNFYFMQDDGYFSQAAETQLLLHTWSLSVEEQFYLLFPICLLIASFCRVGSASFIRATLAVSIVFNALVLWLFISGQASDWDLAQPNAAFFFTPFRFYEILIGANLAILYRTSRTNPAPALATVGLVAIFLCALTFRSGMYYPGIWGVLPSVGAALVIAGVTTNRGWASWVLTRPTMLFLGRISYSLYLWHWPIIVTWNLIFPDHHGAVRILSVLALTLAFSYASYRFIEWPIYKGSAIRSNLRLVACVTAATAALLVLPISAFNHEGLPSRIPTTLLAERDGAYLRPLEGFADCDAEGTCVINDGQGVEPSFLFWGDSHAEGLLPAVALAAQKAGVTGLYAQQSGCIALLGVWQDRKGYETECDNANQRAAELIERHPSIRTVIVASRWALYYSGERYRNDNGHRVVITDATGSKDNKTVFANGMARTIDKIDQLGANIFFVRQVPEVSFPVADTWARRHMFGLGDFPQEPRANYDKRNSEVDALMRSFQSAQIIDLTSKFCDSRSCGAISGGKPIYRDNNHVTFQFSASFPDSFLPVLQNSKIAVSGK